MFPTKASFCFFQRDNYHMKSRKEWALNMRINDTMWTIRTWEKKPASMEVEECKTMAVRVCEMYHSFIKVPSFKMDVE